jgi:hypothetical protein
VCFTILGIYFGSLRMPRSPNKQLQRTETRHRGAAARASRFERQRAAAELRR